jgi:hypothetical protein
VKGNLADKAELAVGHGNDRRRPRQPIDHGEVADDRTRTENRNYPLLALRRCQADLEQTLIEPIATVARIPLMKKRVAGLRATQPRAGKQLRRKQAGPCAGNGQLKHSVLRRELFWCSSQAIPYIGRTRRELSDQYTLKYIYAGALEGITSHRNLCS